MTTATTIHKPCVDCEKDGVETLVQVRIPHDVKGIFRDQWERLPRRCPMHLAEDVERLAAEDREREEAENAQIVEQRERDCGLPPELRRLPWEKRNTAAIKAAQNWADGELRGLLLLGAVGRGKTFLAATAAWHRLPHELLKWTAASGLVTQLDGGFGSIERSRALALVNGRRGLVIDDLDKARPSATVAEMLLLAIDNRMTAGRPLLVTMNTELSEVAARFPEPYGDALASRLRGYCKGYRLGGDDRRVS